MKKIITVLLFTAVTSSDTRKSALDSISERMDIQEGKINALDEQVLLNESDLGKLNKIKDLGLYSGPV